VGLLSQQAGPPDEQAGLVRRLKCRSTDAFDELLDCYQGPVYGFVYRLLDDSADAADVTQEVFIKVFRKIDDFRGDCTLKTWVYRIAVNEASNRRRWFKRHRRNETPMDDKNGVPRWDWLRDPAATPFDALHQREQSDLVQCALRDVDDRLRAAVVLRDLEGLSYNEIADALEISLGTVKSRILRGREALKVALERRMAAGASQGAFLQQE
jgi:RNA polymerase sigma-70 factor (ECF subfamily)